MIVRRYMEQFLKRICQAGSGSVKKHAGAANAKCVHGIRLSRISFLDLSRRQSNAFEPESFVTDFQPKPLANLIFALQADFANEGGVVGRGGRRSQDLKDADSG
jgi:hypothetical protein